MGQRQYVYDAVPIEGVTGRAYPRSSAAMSVAASGLPAVRRSMMANRFKVGDRVTWNSEAGHVSGTIIKIHTEDVNYKGHTHRASEDDPQYEIKSSKTEHIAMHRGAVLKHAKA